MIIRITKDTLSSIYLDALSIRQAVFVTEQQVPLALEIDQDEAKSIHFVLYEQEKALATARILPKSDNIAKLQRMAVISSARGCGMGAHLINEIEQFCIANQFQEITLGAQLSAQGFYQSLGYLPVGPTFIDAGIEHITMHKQLLNQK